MRWVGTMTEVAMRWRSMAFEDEVGVEPPRHDHGAPRQEKADRTVRSRVVERPDDEVRAQSRHVVACHRFQPIFHRRSDLVGELDCLGPAGRPRGVDQVRRRGQIARLAPVRRRFDAGPPTTRVLHVRQHEESAAARRCGRLGEGLGGGPDRLCRAIVEEVLHFLRREVGVDEDRADPREDRRRVDEKRLAGVLADYGQSGPVGEVELEQGVRHPDDSVFDVAPRERLRSIHQSGFVRLETSTLEEGRKGHVHVQRGVRFSRNARMASSESLNVRSRLV